MAFFFLLIGLYASIFPFPVMARETVRERIDGATAIIEANRLLEEELKLAARPQIYMVLDLSAQVILIKSRGIELHRLPVAGWRQVGEGSVTGVFRLRARPSVNRPKAAPAENTNTTVTAIELQHMPDRYDLVFDPGLIISVGQSARERPWPWVRGKVEEWWSRLAGMLGMTVNADGATELRIHLTLLQEVAQSLAWTMTDGMPLIIGRTALPS
ncbi:MAG: hypothetical protein H0W13_05980 [Nitrospirales bacterium]|nr:hypothetical protein [Nitrospirales bacterium]